MTQESYNSSAVVLTMSAFRSMCKAELTNTSAMACMKTMNYVEEEVQSRIRTRRIRDSGSLPPDFNLFSETKNWLEAY